MSDDTFKKALHWVQKTQKKEFLALHNFGEPLIHPKFEEMAHEFSKCNHITMSTNGMLVDEARADKLVKVRWAWISISPWKPEDAARAKKLLNERGIATTEPPGVTHNWAGQSDGPKKVLFKGCHFLDEGKAVIRWNGDVTTCCITDKPEDVIGNIDSEPEDVTIKGYSLCTSCHHAK